MRSKKQIKIKLLKQWKSYFRANKYRYNQIMIKKIFIQNNFFKVGNLNNLTNKKIYSYLTKSSLKTEYFKYEILKYSIIKLPKLISQLFRKQLSFNTSFAWRAKYVLNRNTLIPAILFASTTTYLGKIIKKAALRCGMAFHVNKWLSGSITAQTIWMENRKKWRLLPDRIAVKKIFHKLEIFFNLVKEDHSLKFLYKKLKRPLLLCIPDISNNWMIVNESKITSIPVIGILNSNCKYTIDYPILGNDNIYFAYFVSNFLSFLIQKETSFIYSLKFHNRYYFNKKFSKIRKFLIKETPPKILEQITVRSFRKIKYKKKIKNIVKTLLQNKNYIVNRLYEINKNKAINIKNKKPNNYIKPDKFKPITVLINIFKLYEEKYQYNCTWSKYFTILKKWCNKKFIHFFLMAFNFFNVSLFYLHSFIKRIAIVPKFKIFKYLPNKPNLSVWFLIRNRYSNLLKNSNRLYIKKIINKISNLNKNNRWLQNITSSVKQININFKFRFKKKQFRRARFRQIIRIRTAYKEFLRKYRGDNRNKEYLLKNYKQIKLPSFKKRKKKYTILKNCPFFHKARKWRRKLNKKPNTFKKWGIYTKVINY